MRLPELVREVVTVFVIVAPLLVFMLDMLVWHWFGEEATISGVVRRWHAVSAWPEAVFLFVVVVLYLHFFRGWL